MKEQGKTQWGNLQFSYHPWQEFLKQDLSEHIAKLNYKSGITVYTMEVLNLPTVMQDVILQDAFGEGA